jgi:hypothetical protein
MASDKATEEFWQMLEEMAQTGSSGLVPNDKRWVAIEREFLRTLLHRGHRVRLDHKKDLKQITEELIKDTVRRRPKIAEKVVTLITSNPRLIKTYWLPWILEIVSFAEYGIKSPRITKHYLNLLMNRQPKRLKELSTELQNREGATSEARFGKKNAVESEVGFTLVEVQKRLTKVSPYAVANFRAYLWTTFRNNLLKAVYHDDTSLPSNDYKETEWAKKLRRRKKQSLDELQQIDEGKKADAALKNISPPSTEEAVIASGLDLLRLIPERKISR